MPETFFKNKVAGLRPVALIKKRPWDTCFPGNFVNFFKNTFFKEHLQTTASGSFETWQ